MTLSRNARFAFASALLIAGLVLPSAPARGEQASPVTTSVPSWSDAVCYEIFVRSFADSDGDGSGDLAGLTARLDYLNDGDPKTTDDLGVTCVWLMPVFEASSYHGYDVEDYYAIESDYGSMADFEHFLAEADARGIRVLLDLVLNHTSLYHPWFQSALADPTSPYRDWYIFADADPGFGGPSGQQVWHETPSGDAFYYGLFHDEMPDLNYRNPAVTAEALTISRYWLDRGVDGFRLDAIKHLIENGPEQENTAETHAWLRAYRAFLDTEYPDALTVGEIFNAGASMLAPYYPDQLHRYFQFEMAGQFLIAAEQGVGDGLTYVFEDALERQPSAPWATFLTNHDQNRAMTTLDGDVAMAKLAALSLLTLPGLPFVYYGEEIGMSGAKPDERIRTPMQWEPGNGHGFTSGEPWQPFQDDAESVNVQTQDGDPDSLLHHYRALIQLRFSTPALGHGLFIALESSDRHVLTFFRIADDDVVLVMINFGDEPAIDVMLSGENSPLPPGTFQPALVFGDMDAAPLEIDVTGSFTEWSPGFSLEAQTGYIYTLTR